MAKEIQYKGHRITSNPHKLRETETGNFSVFGMIHEENGEKVIEHFIFMKVPENEWVHDTEASSDQALIKCAKEYIDDQIFD